MNGYEYWFVKICQTNTSCNSITKYEPWHEISNNVVCATSKDSDQPAHTRSLIRALASHLNFLCVLSFWLNIVQSFYANKEAAQACLSLYLSKCQIVENHMLRLNYQKNNLPYPKAETPQFTYVPEIIYIYINGYKLKNSAKKFWN